MSVREKELTHFGFGDPPPYESVDCASKLEVWLALASFLCLLMTMLAAGL